VAVLLIGNEILTGKVQDQNGFEAAKQLRKAGIVLCEIRAVCDKEDDIIYNVRDLTKRNQYIITSGGLGPTHDDVTIRSLALAINDNVIFFPDMLEKLKIGYGKRFTPAVEKMAYLPSRAQIIMTKKIEWPLIKIDNIFLLPGIPQLFKKKLKGVCDILAGQRVYIEELFLDIDEAQIAEQLSLINNKYEKVEIGSYPVWGNPQYRLKLTFESVELNDIQNAVNEFKEKFPENIFIKM